MRFVDAALPAMTNDKVEIWREVGFNVLFKGNDWQGTEKGKKLERDFAALGVEVVYFPYTRSTSSSALRRTLQNIEPPTHPVTAITVPAETTRAACLVSKVWNRIRFDFADRWKGHVR